MIGAVIIGRNEGARLKACLASLQPGVDRIVYVDSGSTDGSLDVARQAGAVVVELDPDVPFTAARARNAGFEQLMADPAPAFVQFVDGDCALRDGWIAAARAFLDAHPQAGVVCGRRRERFPDATLYNRLTDLEWDTPLGRTRSCGGDALMRTRAVAAVGGYNPTLIAGEEPELCVRLRQAGWEVWRIDAEMTWHDAAMTRFRQWWTRTRRAGHAFAEGAALHGAPPERHNIAALRRALLWGLVLPGATCLAGLFVTPWAFSLLLAYPLQAARLARRSGDWMQAGFLTLGKFAEAQGALGYYLRRLTGGQGRLIEYK